MGNKNRVFSLRLSEPKATEIERMAEATGRTYSDVLRQVIEHSDVAAVLMRTSVPQAELIELRESAPNAPPLPRMGDEDLSAISSQELIDLARKSIGFTDALLAEVRRRCSHDSA